MDRVSSKSKKCMLSSTVQSKHNRWHDEVCTSWRKKLTNKTSLPMKKKIRGWGVGGKRLLSISQHKSEFTVLWARYVNTSTFTCNLVSIEFAFCGSFVFLTEYRPFCEINFLMFTTKI